MTKMAHIDLIDCIRASDEFRPMSGSDKKRFNIEEKDPLISRSEMIMCELHTIILDGAKVKVFDNNLKLIGLFTILSYVISPSRMVKTQIQK